MHVPVENKGRTPLYVGDLIVNPGEIRLIDVSSLPPHLRPAPETPPLAPPEDPVVVLADKTLAEIRDAVSKFREEQLDALVKIEAAKEKPRAGVADAVTRERLRRAEAKAKLEDFHRAVSGMDANQLNAYRENVAQHPELLAAVDAEIGARKGDAGAEDEAP